MKQYSTLIGVVSVMLAVFVLAACEQEGPAERAGAKIDSAVEETKEEMQQVREDVEEKTGVGESGNVVEEVKEEAREAKEAAEDTLKR